MKKFVLGAIAAVLLLCSVTVLAVGAAPKEDPTADNLVQFSQTGTEIVSSDLLPDVAALAMDNLSLTIEFKGCETCEKGPFTPDVSFNADGMGVVVFDGISTLLVGDEFILAWDGVQLGDPIPGPVAYGDGHIYTVVVGVYGDQTFLTNIHHVRQVVWCGAHIGYCPPSSGDVQFRDGECPANHYWYKAGNGEPLVCLPY